MDASQLPLTILQEIFLQLTGYTVLQCRQVCSRWCDAMDSLSEAQWHKICKNDVYLYQGYKEAHEKHGLTWFDTFKALHSWTQVGSAEMATVKLCENATVFKVLPHGIVSCAMNKNMKKNTKLCDTVAYYNTNTGAESDREEYDFEFYPSGYDENAHLQVHVLKNKKLCIIVKATKKKYFVGSMETCLGKFEMTLIGKAVYFKNASDNIIYKSQLTKKNTLKTKCLEAFEENHENFDAETIIGFVEKDGDPIFISDEGSTWRANIYHHRNADLEWTGNPNYDDEGIFADLADSGINWKTNWVFKWVCEINNMHPDSFGLYANDMVIVSLMPLRKVINIHRAPYFIPGLNLLIQFLQKEKPVRQISLTKDLIKEANIPSKFKIQLDVIETPTSHKVLALIHNSLWMFDLKESVDKIKTDVKNIVLENLPSTERKTESKKISRVGKVKKTVLSRKKGVKRALLNHKHAHATRSTTKL